LHIWILYSPPIPLQHTLVENVELLLIRHRPLPSFPVISLLNDYIHSSHGLRRNITQLYYIGSSHPYRDRRATFQIAHFS
jgi:hypothetical protein